LRETDLDHARGEIDDRGDSKTSRSITQRNGTTFVGIGVPRMREMMKDYKGELSDAVDHGEGKVAAAGNDDNDNPAPIASNAASPSTIQVIKALPTDQVEELEKRGITVEVIDGNKSTRTTELTSTPTKIAEPSLSKKQPSLSKKGKKKK
jgi:hypothetical protein